ncbi:hypothetical protein [Roseomonas elaeocarpi]|uniref:Uncharacterized protein n=1 Tax=Roseomonas elaeocarpi TaxID=907779 RepID=A0ABV6JUH7_9PROT
MFRRPALVLPLLLGLAACATPDNAPSLPAIAATQQEPVLAAVYGAQPVFRDTSRVAGKPYDAAIAAIRLEWLAAEMPHDLAFKNSKRLTIPATLAARDNLRMALGIPASTPSPVVLSRLSDAAAALRDGNTARARQVLSPPSFSADTLDRLTALPQLPQANLALLLAQKDLDFGGDLL